VSFDAASLPLSQPLRRVLAVALLLAAVGVIAAGIVLPLLERYGAIEAGIAESRIALRRFDEKAQRLPRLEAEHDALKAALAAQDGFLKATSDSLIAAEMQARIRSVVEHQGGQLRSTQIVPARAENGFRRITARVEIMGDAAMVERVWYEMESGIPFMFIDTFDIQSRQELRRDRTQPPIITLDVRFEVSAYARGTGTP
jgi:general secretion pathway protein M